MLASINEIPKSLWENFQFWYFHFAKKVIIKKIVIENKARFPKVTAKVEKGIKNFAALEIENARNWLAKNKG